MNCTNKHNVLLAHWAVIILALTFLIFGASGQQQFVFAGTPHSLTVMTQNMYVGANIEPIFTAAPEDVPLLVAQTLAAFQATNISERAAAIAGEIHAGHADLVSLQEVYAIVTPDWSVDFLTILLSALAAYPDGYYVAGKVTDTIALAPMITPSYDIVWISVIDSDVILARGGVKISNIVEQRYQLYLPLPSGINVFRGYISLDAVVHGDTYRFIDTHLESAVDLVRQGQAFELIQTFIPMSGPVIIAGDFNSAAPDGDAYAMMLAAGYRDAWLAGKSHGTGFTCCQQADLLQSSSLNSRVDFIFTRGLDARVKARTVGDTDGERTTSGLWPSDHAGVVVTFHWK